MGENIYSCVWFVHDTFWIGLGFATYKVNDELWLTLAVIEDYLEHMGHHQEPWNEVKYWWNISLTDKKEDLVSYDI